MADSQSVDVVIVPWFDSSHKAPMSKQCPDTPEASVLARRLSARLAAEQKRLAKSNKDFSRLIGMDHNSFHELMTGRANPTFKSVERVASRLGVDPASLISADAVES